MLCFVKTKNRETLKKQQKKNENNRYLLLMRKIQSTYLLEPAGSRGVWGLDDYQFLSFYFGAAQLVDNTDIKPSDILQTWALQQANQWMYLSCIAFILKMKTGLFLLLFSFCFAIHILNFFVCFFLLLCEYVFVLCKTTKNKIKNQKKTKR